MQIIATMPSAAFAGAKSAALLLLALAISGCSDSNNRPVYDSGDPVPDLLPIAEPEVELPPDIRRTVLTTTQFDLATVGFQQAEFFISGEATSFTNLSELGSDGRWQVEPATTAPYKTRIVVIRPIEDADFSGTVFVEWLNVTAGFELPVSYGTAHTELLRRGHAVVLLTAQFVGVEGSENSLLPLYLKAVNPARYGSLNHPGDSFSYDMLTQVAGVRDGTIPVGIAADHLLQCGSAPLPGV